MNSSRAVLHTVHKSYLQIELPQIADYISKCRGRYVCDHLFKSSCTFSKNTIHKHSHNGKASSEQLEFSRLRLFYSIQKHPSEHLISSLTDTATVSLLLLLLNSLVLRSVTALCKVLNCTGCVTYLSNELLVMREKLKNFCLN